jgi:glycosyltransferase involved in cell wall biosynthesis
VENSNGKVKVANVIVDLSMGGIERLTLNLCAHLDRDIFDPVVVCISGDGPLEDEARATGIPIEIVGVPVHNLPKAVSALKKTFAKLLPDVIHGNPGMTARLAAPKGVPVISQYHSMLLGRGKASLLVDRYLSGKSTYIIGISEAIARNAEMKIGLKSGAINVIYNGVDLDKVQRLSRETAEPLPGDGLKVAFLGRLADEKAGDVLIKAWHDVARSFPEARLFFIGNGDKREEWGNLAVSLDVNANFLGQKTNPYPLLKQADLFVLPSREGPFELVLVEAMALGLPCVVSDAGGIPEVAGDAAVLFKSEDADGCANAIVNFLRDDSLRAKYAKLARERARVFTIQKMAENYGKLYLKALGK